MNEFDPSRHWSGVYERKAATEASWYQDVPRQSLEWIAEVAPPDANPRIVDVGAGASTLVDHLLARGYERITLLDIAEPALAQVAARLPPEARSVDFVIADLLSFAPRDPFDVWHDRAVLHFLRDPADQCRYADRLHAAVVEDGFAVIATFAVGGPERCSGLPTVQYDAGRLMALVGSHFELIRETTESHRTPSGSEQLFAYFLLRHSPA